MNFDEQINRIGTHSKKWNSLEKLYGIDPQDSLAMWVADTDFRPPQAVLDALQNTVDHGVFGYYNNDASVRESICSWMDRRHQWAVDPAEIFFVAGLVNGTGLCLHTWTEPGDGIVLFTPVYHAFARVINGSSRRVVECEMINDNGRYELDFDAYDAQMDGSEKMLILCTPHNPGGRVWTAAELRGIADFARRHDLMIIADQVHQDITLGPKVECISNIAPDIIDRLVILSAPSKIFNVAGAYSGHVMVPDPALRKEFAKTLLGLGVAPNNFGLIMTEAAYNNGDDWVDAHNAYIAENAAIFDEGINAIPGVHSMKLESTYLAWVDFSGTGMSMDEIDNRVVKQARVAPNYGHTFGKGGESFMRFNLGMTRANVENAVERLQAAFRDLQ